MAIALQRPDSARARPSSLVKDESDYKRVFSDEHPLHLYAASVLLMKRVDTFLRSEAIGMNRKDQTNLRFYVAMLAAMKLAATHHLKPTQVASVAFEKLTDQDLTEVLNEAKSAYAELGSSDQAAKGPELLRKLSPESSKLPAA